MINHGIIPGTKSTDFAAGTIPYEIRNPSGNWRPYLVRAEKQYFQSFDTMGCVSFATNNSCEIQIKQQTGIEVNFSDRFLAKMSGTTDQGNWVYIVLDTWRNIGCVNEEEWPAPPEPTNRAAYYVTIPQFIIDRAKKQSTDKYKLEYEVISDRSAASITKHLKHSPLLITIPGHEITGIVLSIEGNTLTCFDHYELNSSDPFIRKINLSDIDFIYKAVLTVRGESMVFFKIKGNAAIYEMANQAWRGYANFEPYQADILGRPVVVIELDQVEFNKLPQLSPVKK